MNIRTRSLGLLTATAALALAAPLVAPAQADPGFVPDANDVVGVGSDTTERVVQALAGRYNSVAQTEGRRLASFNATGSASIVVRQGTAPITRPNGSSAGIDELQANGNVSFARSSRGPRAGDEGTTFFPYARDRLGYVFNKPSSNVNKNLGPAQLQRIYTCQATNWSQFNRPAGLILARIPQAGSGTRAFFLAEIGVTEAQLFNAIAQPNDVCSVVETQEHDPQAVIGKPNAISPFSFARFKTLSAATKTQIGYAQNAPFNVSRDVYNVIRTANAAGLAPFFNESSWICTSAAAGDVIARQGFTRLGAGACGVGISF